MIVRVLDIESTGLNPETDRVIELGWSDYHVQDKTITEPKSILFHAASLAPENRAVHHIMPSQLVGRKAFDAEDFNRALDGIACLAAHNASFESSFLHPALPIICTMKVAMHAWPDAPAFGNQVLRYWLEDADRLPGFNYAHAGPAHRAGPDAYVTAHILKALFATGLTGKEMVAISKLPAKLPRCPMGKHKGQAWADVPSGYLQWIMKADDMGADVQSCAELELARRSRSV